MPKIAEDLYAQVGLSQIPHILSLADRNLFSPTYGCFDRSYWHYKTAAFPSGMYQEFVLPLALVHRHAFPGGEVYYRRPRLRELAIAGIRYASKSCHKDGSCDDYFPYERALGAVAFSLYACTESYLLLELDEQDLVSFFHKRARWLAHRHEAGRLSNHHALAVVALYNVFLLTGDEDYLKAVHKRLDMLLSWQSEEGWFPEYEGCDPGYLTATIDFLAKYHQKSQDDRVMEPLRAAVRFASQFMHPDGSYGGEYGSRNTALFFPHGFELLAGLLPEASCVSDLYLRGILRDRRVHVDDDRLCAHLTYNHLQACLDVSGRTEDPPPYRKSEERYWKGARLYLNRKNGLHAVISAAKGGVIRLYTNDELTYADSGLIVRLANGLTLVSHLTDDYETTLLDGGIRIEGHLGPCRFRLPSAVAQAFFHLGMSAVGHWASDWVRALLQRLLIVGKRTDPMRFRRTFLFKDTEVVLVDELWRERNPEPSRNIEAMYAGTDHTSIYVAVSQSYQSACLHPWTDYAPWLKPLNEKGYVRIERVIG